MTTPMESTSTFGAYAAALSYAAALDNLCGKWGQGLTKFLDDKWSSIFHRSLSTPLQPNQIKSLTEYFTTCTQGVIFNVGSAVLVTVVAFKTFGLIGWFSFGTLSCASWLVRNIAQKSLGNQNIFERWPTDSGAVWMTEKPREGSTGNRKPSGDSSEDFETVTP